jgi:hypothetical protein
MRRLPKNMTQVIKRYHFHFFIALAQKLPFCQVNGGVCPPLSTLVHPMAVFLADIHCQNLTRGGQRRTILNFLAWGIVLDRG